MCINVGRFMWTHFAVRDLASSGEVFLRGNYNSHANKRCCRIAFKNLPKDVLLKLSQHC